MTTDRSLFIRNKIFETDLYEIWEEYPKHYRSQFEKNYFTFYFIRNSTDGPEILTLEAFDHRGIINYLTCCCEFSRNDFYSLIKIIINRRILQLSLN